MSASYPGTSGAQAEMQIRESHATQWQTKDSTKNALAERETAARALATAAITPSANERPALLPVRPGIERLNTQGTSKSQKSRESLSRMGLRSKATGEGKSFGKTDSAKFVLEEPQDVTESRIVLLHDPPAAPRVDIIAVHDVDESLQTAWVYRKKPRRRAGNLLGVYTSGGINSHDGEGGLGTAGSPAPGSRKQRRPAASPTGKKKMADDSHSSIERWLTVSATSEEQTPRDTPGETPLDDHGPTSPIFAPAGEHECGDSSILGMLASVPEDHDNITPSQTPDDIFWQRRVRGRPTLSRHRRKSAAGRISTINEEEAVPSVGDASDGRRHNADVLSDRRSSQDHGVERRANWLSDLDMLPSEIQGTRSMCYTYRGIEKIPSAWQYLTERAEDLVKQIIQKRTSDHIDYGRVPIVLIGLGFGALIVQRAMNLMAIPSRTDANPTTDLGMVAGVILLDAPSPSQDREQFPRSLSQEIKKTWTQDWLGKTSKTPTGPLAKIDTLSMWHRFSPIASAYNIPIVWHYSPMLPAPGKVCSIRDLEIYPHIYIYIYI
ncbi:hypothetical protein B0H67DRAFT_300187 [Lasiosphaeris hirsuta]|uniref:Uncharacterized protein n=1 Tax=Lasiosphaeris hirsuta TaxID=260670 RepID=A0AA40A9I4_9PEZI|nr:hypothetical protein B0H67DRAFT_300187 [Lasiosphaeris hirsuta]